jgi:hypothetical protein
MRKTCVLAFAIAVSSTSAFAATPGQNFNLANWTLQLPVVSGSSIQQISGSQLESGYTSKYFFSASDGSMAFWCPVNGGTTPNSHYSRSELREKRPGGDWPLTGTHTLNAKCRVTKVPSNGRIIIGQVHGNASQSELCKLLWNAGKLEARVQPNRESEVGLPLGTFSLGATLTYTLKISNKVLTVTANGKTVTYSYSASLWQSDRYYFKAGSYVQDNVGSSTEGGQVQFSSLSVSHN